MSKISVKTTYESIGPYGETIELDVYAHHDGVSDTITFYNHEGVVIMTIDDTVVHNLLAAIINLNDLVNTTPMSTEDRVKCGIIKNKDNGE